MNTTPVSLLERLRQPDNQTAWARFVDLYTPLLCYWGRRVGLNEPDVADLIQDVFCILTRKLPDFTYDSKRTFRGWLRTVLMNQWRTSLRRHIEQSLPETFMDPVDIETCEAFIEKEYRDYLIGRALQVMKTDFLPSTWQACWEHVACGRPVAEVASELGTSEKAVYLAKARVLKRLRQELEGLWD
jgi:RNA polymerase sigma-70 factor (ECF subfamily)